MHVRRGLLLWLGVFVVVITLATIFVVRSRADSMSDTVSAASSTAVASSPSASPVVVSTPSLSKVDEAARQVISSRTQELTEAYYLLLPSDTLATRQQRMHDLGLSEDQIARLKLNVGQTSCGDQARLDPTRPLTEKATVESHAIDVQLVQGSPEQLYVVAQVTVAQYMGDGSRYEGTAQCQSMLPGASFTMWEQVNGQWHMTAFGAREVIL